jgi:3-oxoacyl-[acyl-carrier-protein] synthase-3
LSVSNAELTQFPSSSLPLIQQKTGISSRRRARADQCTSDLAIEAARACLAKVGMRPDDVDGIILATSSPDRLQPATATRVQHEIGAHSAFAFDVNSVCSGGVFALSVADSMIRAGSASRMLVIAAEMYSRFLNPSDFSTFPYFGDGAGAVLLEAVPDSSPASIGVAILRTDGSGNRTIEIPAGGSMMPGPGTIDPRNFYFKMAGKDVYAFAVEKGSEVVMEVLAKASIPIGDIRAVISHQANINILKEISNRTKLPMDRFFVNLDRLGNTAAASVFIALDEARETGFVSAGDSLLLVAFGGGLSWAACAITL